MADQSQKSGQPQIEEGKGQARRDKFWIVVATIVAVTILLFVIKERKFGGENTDLPSSSQTGPATSAGCTVLEEGVTIVPLRQGIKSGCYSLKRGTHLSYTFASRGCIEVYPNSRPAVRDCNKDVIKLSDGSEYLTRIAFKAEEATEVLVTITRK